MIKMEVRGKFDYILREHCVMPITTSDKIKKFLDKIRGHQKDDLHDTYL